jgi:hypothetical protein
MCDKTSRLEAPDSKPLHALHGCCGTTASPARAARRRLTFGNYRFFSEVSLMNPEVESLFM